MTAFEGALCVGKHDEPPRAACVGQTRLFTSGHPTDHEQAKTICLNHCPRLALCDAERLEEDANTPQSMRDNGGGFEGTWAGVLYGERRPVGRPRKNRETVA